MFAKRTVTAAAAMALATTVFASAASFSPQPGKNIAAQDTPGVSVETQRETVGEGKDNFAGQWEPRSVFKPDAFAPGGQGERFAGDQLGLYGPDGVPGSRSVTEFATQSQDRLLRRLSFVWSKVTGRGGS